MTAALIVSIACLIVLATVTFLVALKSFRALEAALTFASTVDERSRRHVDSLLNRLMTINWEDFAVVQAQEEAEEGEFLLPSDQPQVAGELDDTLVDASRYPRGAWGSLSPSEEEQKLIDEDFAEADR